MLWLLRTKWFLAAVVTGTVAAALCGLRSPSQEVRWTPMESREPKTSVVPKGRPTYSPAEVEAIRAQATLAAREKFAQKVREEAMGKFAVKLSFFGGIYFLASRLCRWFRSTQGAVTPEQAQS